MYWVNLVQADCLHPLPDAPAPTLLKHVIFFLLLAKIPFLGHLCMHTREWVSQDVRLTFGQLLCGLLLVSSQTGAEQDGIFPS